MTKTQFIAHADAPKTFAHKKGATAAIKRDLTKHFDAHGDVLFDTGFEVRESGDRFGVVLFVDLTPSKAKELVGTELEGYVIEPQLDEPKTDDAAPVAKADEPSRKGRVEIAPSGLPLIPARHGSKQQFIIEMLAREEGASLHELVDALVRRDGTQWKPESLMAGLYHHFPQKGYGISTTEDVNGTFRYHLVYPNGINAPAAPRRPQSQQVRVDRMRSFFKSNDSEAARKVEALGDDALLEKFKNVTELKAYVAKMENI